MPSPTNYETSNDAVWDKRKEFTLGGKATTWPYDTRKDAHVTIGPGAGHYLSQRGDTGSGGRRASVSDRHRDGIHAGYPNSLVPPVDTHGFSTPGPCEFRPESEWGRRPSIGVQLEKNDGSTIGPGPASYSLPREQHPAPLIGRRLSTDTDQGFPAPSQYTLPEDSGLARSFGLKATTTRGFSAPPPNQYYIRKPRLSSSHSFTHRPFEWKSEPKPGPSEYFPSASSLPLAPDYSCRPQTKPVFPDILNYPEHTTLETPGAGAYEFGRDFSDNSNPAHVIALPLIQPPNTNPAPNQYKVNHSPTLPRPPSHFMGRQLGGSSSSGGGGEGGRRKRRRERSQSPSPGPADYHPQPPSAPSLSFTPRRNTQKVSSTPAPNRYSIEGGQTHRGQRGGSGAATMKGRPSPVVYSGFPSSYMHRLQS